MNSWAQGEGAPGLGWISFSDGEAKGPIAKRLGDERLHKLKELAISLRIVEDEFLFSGGVMNVHIGGE